MKIIIKDKNKSYIFNNKFNNQAGFTLIEIVIALLMGSIITISLYQMLFQTQKSSQLIRSTIESDIQIPILYNQLQRDIISIINQPTYIPEKSQSEIGKAISQLSQALEKRKGSSTQSNLSAKKEDIKIQDIFTSNGNGNNFDISFITTGGTKSIDLVKDDNESELNTRLKRVRYWLEKDQEQSNFLETDIYKIMYHQETNIIENISKSDQAYEIATNIKSISLKYYVYKPLELNRENNNKQEIKSELIELNSWNQKDIKKEYKTSIPAFIDMDIKFINSSNINDEKELTFKFEVLSYTIPITESKAKPN